VNKNYTLVSARKEIGLTQSELASLIGCKKTAISNWENGYASPRLREALKLANVLKKSVENIFFDYKVQ
jgi:putative transcriptional regulator